MFAVAGADAPADGAERAEQGVGDRLRGLDIAGDDGRRIVRVQLHGDFEIGFTELVRAGVNLRECEVTSVRRV